MAQLAEHQEPNWRPSLRELVDGMTVAQIGSISFWGNARS